VSAWSRAKDQLNEVMLQAARKEAKERGENPSEVTIEPWRIRRTAATRMAKVGTAPHVVEAALNQISGVKAGRCRNLQSRAVPRRKSALLWTGLAREIECIVSGK
jgi:hypothetical protein